MSWFSIYKRERVGEMVQFVQIGDFESTVNELHFLLYFASLAASNGEIRSLKVDNYARCILASLHVYACGDTSYIVQT